MSILKLIIVLFVDYYNQQLEKYKHYQYCYHYIEISVLDQYPVSYTHLDVYKRQELYTPTIFWSNLSNTLFCIPNANRVGTWVGQITRDKNCPSWSILGVYFFRKIGFQVSALFRKLGWSTYMLSLIHI